jgi:serine/threonine protein kinase
MDSPLKYTRKLLGKGKYGYVFEGSLHGKLVAVKRVLRTHLEHGDREEAIMAQLNHQNIIKLLFTEDTEEFR